MGAISLRVLVTSEKDIASLTIKKILIDEYDFTATDTEFEGNPVYALGSTALLITTARDLIYSDHLEQFFDAEAFIFCSRHKAKSEQPALLVHSTGNLGGEAAFGGEPYRLSVSTASLMSRALCSLARERETRGLNEFDVSMEVTHHGPTGMSTPLVFVELGSNEKYWTHMEGARAVASAVLDCVKQSFVDTAVIGIGGTHYARKFNGVVLSEQYCVGHMAPKYALDEITPHILEQMISRSREKIVAALIDWKGTNSQQRNRVFPMLERIGIELIRI